MSDSVQNTPNQDHFPGSVLAQTNGHDHAPTSNGNVELPIRDKTATAGNSEDNMDSNASEPTDTSIRFEAMSQEREALRAEVEQLRKSLEDIQGKHTEEVAAMKAQHEAYISDISAQHTEEKSTITAQHSEQIATIRGELEESETAKEHAQSQYQNLLGRVNTIRNGLTERLKADREELAEAKEQIEELDARNETLNKRVEELKDDVKRMERESHESSKELSGLRNRHNLSQNNWLQEREDLVQQIRQLREEAEAAREAMGDWEVLAMEERSMREGLTERVRDLDEQFSAQKEAYEIAVSDKDSQSQAVEGLQRALQEVQEARKRELREMVESYEEQVQSLKKIVQESDKRALEAEASTGSLQTELDRLIPFEKEVKEKNLLIGKLRHEAIVLNDHLTKALRFLKKAKPEDNIDRRVLPSALVTSLLILIDRQIVTNHFLHFLALDRSDPKKFQILQLIASLLNWTDEQKEQAGLARPGASSGSLRLPMSPFHRTPSTPSLSAEFFTDSSTTKESLADLWTGFLERSAEEGSVTGSRSGSVSSAATPRPDVRNER